MPQPRLVVATRQQAHRLGQRQAEYIEAPSVALYAGEQSPVRVAETKDPSMDRRLAPKLIHLTDAQDVTAKSWDVVYL